MTGAVVVRGTDIFASEIREARRLGFRLDVKTDDGQAYARLTPTTPHATVAVKAAAEQAREAGKRCIEARQPYTDPREMPEAIRQSVRSVLTLAAEIT